LPFEREEQSVSDTSEKAIKKGDFADIKEDPLLVDDVSDY